MIFERIKTLRELKKWSRKELAEKLNVSESLVAKWESTNYKYRRDPSTNHLIKLAEAFEISLDYLLGKTNIPVSTEEQFIINDINEICSMDKIIDEFAEKHGILFDDGKRYSKEELDKIIKHYIRMINTFKDITD